ncbi:hypothetical protein CHS0354_042479 [Potamilus streckersoni]|uniref:Uncharacterized protein n=1 Tax=Potamilus streckersoni TaxID=2493646 RepID=A0AAE0S9W0_9BIVA|nr:hypothetical protein CHS0354_042479 [Potamilus streckersoni]
MGMRLKFVCTGNTGSDPDASIIWEAMSKEVFVVRSQSLSTDVRMDEMYESTGGCTVLRRSELLYNLTTAADTKNFIVRCKVKIQPPQLQVYEVSSSCYHLQKANVVYPNAEHQHPPSRNQSIKLG